MLKYIKTTDFICFKGTQTVDFAGHDGVILIVGSYDEDPQMSNQAGKTTILHAILYGLYGWSKDLCDKETDLIYEENGVIADFTEVEIGLELAGKNLVVRRGRTKENKPIFSVDGFGGHADELQAQLEKELGMPFQDFLATTFFQQGDIHVFMDAKPAEKKEYLKRWLDFSRWDDYADKMREHVTVHDGEVAKLRSEIDALQRTVSEVADVAREQQLTEERANRQRQVELGHQAELQTQHDIEALPDARAQEQAIVDLRKAMMEPERQMGQARQAIDAVDQQIARGAEYTKELEALAALNLDAAVKDLESQIAFVDQEFDSLQVQIQEKEQQVGEYEPKVKDVDARILQLHGQERQAEQRRNDRAGLLGKIKGLGSHCPFDQKPCDRVGPGFLSELETAHGQCAAELTTTQNSCCKLREERTALVVAQQQVRQTVIDLRRTVSQRTEAMREMQKRNAGYTAQLQRRSFLQGQPSSNQLEAQRGQAILNLNGWVAQVGVLRNQVEAAEKELAQFSDVQQKRQDLQKRLTDAQQLRTGATARISEIDRLLGEFSALRDRQAKAAQQMVQEEQALSVANEARVRWQFLEQMCRREIPSILTENAFEEVENETNFVLRGLHSNMSIQFQATRELQAKEDVCSVCASPFPARAKTCQVCGYGERKKKRKDELVLDVQQGTSIRSFRLVSGGGKALISIALRIALTKLLQRKRGSPIDWLHLDEVFATLDPINRMSVVRMVFDILLTVMGFRQIFVISHTDVSDSGAHILRVQRHQDYSTVGWA